MKRRVTQIALFVVAGVALSLISYRFGVVRATAQSKLSFKDGVRHGRGELERILNMDLNEVYLSTETRTLWTRFNTPDGKQFFSFVRWPNDRELRVLKKFSPASLQPPPSSGNAMTEIEGPNKP